MSWDNDVSLELDLIEINKSVVREILRIKAKDFEKFDDFGL